MNNFQDFIYNPQQSLNAYCTDCSGDYASKKDSQDEFDAQIMRLRELQSMLYADGSNGVLIILQAMDAAGKDGVIKHVMSGVNPQGCQVKSFKVPSSEELAHDFMWRCMRALPERGNIGIFNRSYYEEVLIVKVHPQLLAKQNLPGYHPDLHKNLSFWQTRYADIANIEKYLANNGYQILKFFLHLSKDEQKKRFLSRMDNAHKNWKFTTNDVSERQHWDDYQKAYEQMLKHTSTAHAPWYVIPADKKWFMRLAISKIIVNALEQLNLSYPDVSAQHKEDIATARVALQNET